LIGGHDLNNNNGWIDEEDDEEMEEEDNEKIEEEDDEKIEEEDVEEMKLNEEIRKRAKVDERIMKKTDKSDLRIRMVGCDAMSLDGVVRECQADVSKVISMMENMSLEFDRARNATMADDDVEADDVEDDDVEDDDDDMDDDVADPSDPQSSEPRGSPPAIAKLVADEVAKALAADRSTRNTTGARGSGNVGGEEEDEEEEEIVTEDKAEIIYPYDEADSNNRPPPASDDESEFALFVIALFAAENRPVPPVIHFSSTYERGESSSS
nr:hypothetical protein [Tanacetum cinerariifolium]